jgi:hypothetical protein
MEDGSWPLRLLDERDWLEGPVEDDVVVVCDALTPLLAKDTFPP